MIGQCTRISATVAFGTYAGVFVNGLESIAACGAEKGEDRDVAVRVEEAIGAGLATGSLRCSGHCQGGDEKRGDRDDGLHCWKW